MVEVMRGATRVVSEYSADVVGRPGEVVTVEFGFAGGAFGVEKLVVDSPDLDEVSLVGAFVDGVNQMPKLVRGGLVGFLRHRVLGQPPRQARRLPCVLFQPLAIGNALAWRRGQRVLVALEFSAGLDEPAPARVTVRGRQTGLGAPSVVVRGGAPC